MYEILDVFFLIFSAIVAFFALHVKDLLASIALLSAFSFFMCLLWAELGAVDVAFTEASVGAAISTAFFVAALTHLKRKAKD
ncbi:MAG: DUF4040 domain-containing protein [Desulfobacterota bacterium]|nr:DUF4040 domain-containing protein [Thermodesulfobacteriota bacterium]MDW8002139.1 DUF4040 domain-containing protein [Deltaproteobacteria bacterium]